ncbi:MAG: carboxypeptidase family protein [Gammaproteobacteria bacterium]|nr:carboxypeptidase family protein [Gammaproteobacteria bacterium]
MQISSNFDSGNILVQRLDSPETIELAIRRDTNCEFMQWFHFRLQTTAGLAHRLAITNIKDTSYMEGWTGYYAVASYDREEWFRVPTRVENDQLIIEHTPDYDAVFYAYFAPYSYERHLDLVHSAQFSPYCELSVLGQSVQGRDMHLLTVGEQDDGKRKIWVIARQHPGETMAEWFMEGFIERLLDEDDALSRKLRDEAVFYLVPNMNPDGAVNGNLRGNYAGRNLNREWLEPSMEASPEVFLVRQAMHATGVDLLLDIHGDEALPYNFIAACEGIPAYDERMAGLEQLFKSAYVAATPDFQTEHGYAIDKPGEANLSMASNYVGQHFGCLALTLEMPFKDNASLPDYEFGWSPARSMKLAQAIFHPIATVLPQLR